MSGSTSTNALFNQWQAILAQGPAAWAQYGLYDPASGQWTQQGQAIRAAYSSQGQQSQTPPRLEQWLTEQQANTTPALTWEQQLAASRAADYSADPRMQTAAPAFKIWRGGNVSLPASAEQPPQYPWRDPYEQGT